LTLQQVSSFRVIDARYSYEFTGGHIRGAENFGTWDEQVTHLHGFVPFSPFYAEIFPESSRILFLASFSRKLQFSPPIRR
jgi:hypothetical protein